METFQSMHVVVQALAVICLTVIVCFAMYLLYNFFE